MTILYAVLALGGAALLLECSLRMWSRARSPSSVGYFDPVAGEMQVTRDELYRALAAASGKPVDAIDRLFSNSGLERYGYKHLLGFVPLPNQELPHMRINSLGLRGPEAQFTKPLNVKRVLLLGGSVAWGRGATSDSMTIAARLEHHLNEQSSNGLETWEVLNCAIPSGISWQELQILLETGIRFDPDVVLSLNGYNDAYHALDSCELNTTASSRQIIGKVGAKPGIGEIFVRQVRVLSLLSRMKARIIDGLLGPSSQPCSGVPPEQEFIYTIW